MIAFGTGVIFKPLYASAREMLDVNLPINNGCSNFEVYIIFLLHDCTESCRDFFWRPFGTLLNMSIKIKVEDFQDWSGIFEEIKRQQNLKVFTVIAPDTAHFTLSQGKPKCLSSMSEPKRSSYDKLTRRVTVSGAVNQGHSSGKRLSLPSTSNSTNNVDAKKGAQDSRLTDAAKNLTEEQMALLYEDILKPLDVYSILKQRQSQMKIQ